MREKESEREERGKGKANDGRRDGIYRSMPQPFFFLSLQNFQQRYGYKNASLDAKEKAKLQAEILELVFAHGEYWLAKGELLRKR